MTDQDIAEKSAAVFWEGDRFSRGLGIELVEVSPGMATTRVQVSAAHLNVHDTAHGGMLFALGAAAFGVACNSHGTKAVAQTVSVIYTDRAVAEDVIEARAQEISRAGKTAVFDITLSGSDGAVVAMLRGVARTISGSLLG